MSINHVDLRHLRYFLAVAEELNFSRAAERLHISQPPLSRQIAELEQRMDTKLFQRTKRSVRLTAAGQDLMPRARQLLRDMEHGLLTAQAVAQGRIGEIRIATIYTAPMVPAFGDIIRHLRTSAPQAKLSFREMRNTPLLEAMVSNKADIGFCWLFSPLADKRLSSLIITSDPLHFYIPADHALAKKRELTIDDLENDLLFLTSLQMKMPFAQDLRKLARSRDIKLSISEEAAHFSVIANLVAAGCGIGVLPDYIARLASIKLVQKKVKGITLSSLQLPLALIYRADHSNPALASLIKTYEKKKPR